VRRLLSRLAAKYCLSLLAFLFCFELAYQQHGLPLRLSLLAGVAGLCVVWGTFSMLHTESVHIRGRQSMEWSEAVNRAWASGGFLCERFPLVPGLFLPVRYLKAGILTTGGSQTGKTLLQRTLWQWAVSGRTIIAGFNIWWMSRGVRAFFYDGKADLLPVIAGMKRPATCPIYVMQPFDWPEHENAEAERKRGIYRRTRWNLAKDCCTPAAAKTLAKILATVDVEDKEKANFWNKGVTFLLSGVIVRLQELKPLTWTLRDIVLAFRSKEDLLDLLGGSESTEDRLVYLNDPTTSTSDLLKTAANVVNEFQEIAALWEATPNQVSLRQWAKGEGIILCPVDETVRSATDVLYRAMFKMMSLFLLRPSAKKNGRTFVFLDEAREAGPMDGLSSLLVRGFGLGTVTTVSVQSLAGFASILSGSDKIVSEIIGQSRNRIATQTEEAATTKQLSEEEGEQECWVTTPGNGTQGDRRELTRRPVVLPSEYSELRPADEDEGMSARISSPAIRGSTVLELSGSALGRSLNSEDESIACIIEKDETVEEILEASKAQKLERWTGAERTLLELPVVRAVKKPKEGASALKVRRIEKGVPDEVLELVEKNGERKIQRRTGT
jgi:hypothetical protein